MSKYKHIKLSDRVHFKATDSPKDIIKKRKEWYKSEKLKQGKKLHDIKPTKEQLNILKKMEEMDRMCNPDKYI